MNNPPACGWKSKSHNYRGRSNDSHHPTRPTTSPPRNIRALSPILHGEGVAWSISATEADIIIPILGLDQAATVPTRPTQMTMPTTTFTLRPTLHPWKEASTSEEHLKGSAVSRTEQPSEVLLKALQRKMEDSRHFGGTSGGAGHLIFLHAYTSFGFDDRDTRLIGG